MVARICNGETRASSTKGVGKTKYPHGKQEEIRHFPLVLLKNKSKMN
jgi:hypothetical protein